MPFKKVFRIFSKRNSFIRHKALAGGGGTSHQSPRDPRGNARHGFRALSAPEHADDGKCGRPPSDQGQAGQIEGGAGEETECGPQAGGPGRRSRMDAGKHREGRNVGDVDDVIQNGRRPTQKTLLQELVRCRRTFHRKDPYGDENLPPPGKASLVHRARAPTLHFLKGIVLGFGLHPASHVPGQALRLPGLTRESYARLSQPVGHCSWPIPHGDSRRCPPVLHGYGHP
jgi:hypothetical protein